MKKKTAGRLLGLLPGLALAGTASAANINVNANIVGSTTWTANNVYNLNGQIFVEPGATLTIEAGTIIATVNDANRGMLAVCKGAQIFVQGTAENPVIMTSTADVATWDNQVGTSTGKNPKTGTWRAAANEWGNLTIMGGAFIGAGPPKYAANVNSCSAANVAAMEGLTAEFVGDTKVLYGGNSDNGGDGDSGSISYLSIRYGGKVLALTNELNGLSLGGVGRDTDIHHVEIMNNVDDGIEIWGGTVNLKHINIWNVGDDSLDVDQGWRGKAQFGLIVQGYSVVAAQGSGVGDNCIETDGAEDSNWQPVTTGSIYNFTVIGQPVGGDHGTAWRDGARMQYRNCIFMDLGEKLIKNDNSDGDSVPGSGYTFAGTLSFCDIWTTAYTVTSAVNPCANPAARYLAQSAGNAAIGQGKLAEMTDSVFFRNLNAAAYSNGAGCDLGADGVGVTTAPGQSNAGKGNIVAAYGGAGNPDLNMPIQALVRGPAIGRPTLPAGLTQLPVISIDPRAANAAVTSVSSAPSDGFFTPANYRGAFSATDNWLCDWTATAAFGFLAAGSCTTPCDADIAGGNGEVDTDDLLLMLGSWGACPGCPADIDGNNAVDTDDLLALLGAWGPCP